MNTKIKYAVGKFNYTGKPSTQFGEDVAARARKFHSSFTEYKPTSLHRLDALAGLLDLGSLYVKDESTRFGLNAFKVLGGSYCVGRILAVMELNREDGENRRYICVQLPALCDEKSEAYKNGYKTICEIGKERIRRAGKKLLEENTQVKLGDEEKKPLDVGFKVFKLDTSNLRIWNSTPITGDNQIEMFTERMNSMIDSIKDDRTDMDVVYEVMLKMGVPLDIPVQYIEVNGKIVYIVGDFILCNKDRQDERHHEKRAFNRYT